MIPEITISLQQSFTSAGAPDVQQYVITAMIDTADEISHLGRITLPDKESLIHLSMALRSYIVMNGLDQDDPLASAPPSGATKSIIIPVDREEGDAV